MITTVSSRGQTIVPADLRRQFAIEDNAKLEWIADGNEIRVIPLPKDTIRASRGILAGAALNLDLLKERKKERARG